MTLNFTQNMDSLLHVAKRSPTREGSPTTSLKTQTPKIHSLQLDLASPKLHHICKQCCYLGYSTHSHFAVNFHGNSKCGKSLMDVVNF